MGVHSEAVLNRKYMEMIKLLTVYLNHFPRGRTFLNYYQGGVNRVY